MSEQLSRAEELEQRQNHWKHHIEGWLEQKDRDLASSRLPGLAVRRATTSEGTPLLGRKRKDSV